MLHQEVNYTAQQVAKILNCSYQTVIKLIKSGDIKSFRVGADYRVRESHLKEFMERE